MPQVTKFTYADYLAFPADGLRHELIDGAHHVTPSPAARHQRILRRLAFALESWLAAHPAGEMFFAPFDVRLSDTDVVVPDLIYVSRARADRVRERGVFGAPDLVVEILSPGTRRTDEGLKRALYERAGVLEYWVIDPDFERVTVHRREGDRFARPLELTSAGVLTTALLPGWQVTVAKVLG